MISQNVAKLYLVVILLHAFFRLLLEKKKEMLFLKIFRKPSHYPLEPFKKSRYSPRDLKSMVLPNQLWY